MRAILRVFGQVCLTIGMVIALFVGYLFWGSGVRAGQAQRQFAAQLEHAWQGPEGLAERMPADPVRLAIGQPFAFIRIPAGNPFWSLPSLTAGDWVYIDTRYATYIYRVLGKPAWTGTHRVIVTGVLTGVRSRTGGHA